MVYLHIYIGSLTEINVATGEQISNRVMHKQYLQAGGYKILQTDIQRLASINEFLVVRLMAKKCEGPYIWRYTYGRSSI